MHEEWSEWVLQDITYQETLWFIWSFSVIRIVKSRRLQRHGQVAQMTVTRNAYRILVRRLGSGHFKYQQVHWKVTLIFASWKKVVRVEGWNWLRIIFHEQWQHSDLVSSTRRSVNWFLLIDLLFYLVSVHPTMCCCTCKNRVLILSAFKSLSPFVGDFVSWTEFWDMRFKVFMAVKMWIVLFFCVVILCSLVGGYQCFGRMYHLHAQGRNICNQLQDHCITFHKTTFHRILG
jgi:hypothetical protein